MASFKFVLNFTGPEGESWSEVYHRESTDLTAATLFPLALQNTRLNFLDNQCVLRGYRVSSISGTRVAKSPKINLQGLSGTGTAEGNGPGAPGWSIIYTLVGTTGGTRKLWVRGWSEGAVYTDATTGQPVILPNFQRSVEAWITRLAAAGFGILKLTTVVRGPDTTPPITGAAVGQSVGETVLTVKNDVLNIQPGERVLIRGTNRKDYPGLSGSFYVLRAGANSVTVPYRSPPFTTFPSPGGTLRRQTYLPVIPFDPTAIGAPDLGTHRTKALFSGSRGRRSAVRIRQSP